MITVKGIDEILQTYFSGYDQSRGYTIFNSGLVSLIQTKGEEYIYDIGELVGHNSFETVLFFSKSGDRWDGLCDCFDYSEEEDCVHIVAALYELQADLKEQEAARNPQRRRGRPKYVPLENSGSISDRSTGTSAGLEKAKADTFRKIPFRKGQFESAFHKYKNHIAGKLHWGESIEGEVVSATEITLKVSSSYSYHRRSDEKIALKKEGDELFIKCLTCSVKTDKLCAHQTKILEETKYLLKDYFDDHEAFYKEKKQTMIKVTGVEPDAFDKYFSIVIENNIFKIKPIVDNFQKPEWLESSQMLINEQTRTLANKTENHLKQLEQGKQTKYAFYWGKKTTRFSNENEFILHFVHGNGLKTKEGIQSNARTIEEAPTFFPEEYKRIGQKLFFAIREKDSGIRFRKIKEIILKNRALLNNIYQFTYDGNIKYENIKSSQTNLVSFDSATLDCKFSVGKKDGLIHLERFVTLNGEPFLFKKAKNINPVFCTVGDKAYCYENEHFYRLTAMFEEHESLFIPFTNKKEYTQLITGLQQYFEVEVADGILLKEEILQNPKYQILLREVGTFILFEPRLKYGDYSFNPFDKDSYEIDKKLRKPAEEDCEFLTSFLRNAHPDFNKNIQVQSYSFLEVNKLLNNYWFLKFNEACEVAGVEILGQKDLSKFNYSKHRAITFTHVKSGIDWFDVDMGVSFGGENVKTADWIKALRNKESFVRLKDGSLGVLPEEWLKQAQKILAVADLEKGELRISKYRFNIIEDLFDNIDDKEILKELAEKKKRLADLELNQKYKLPKKVKADLRSYQKHGFQWLKFLDQSGLGGILADDMGLGKTVQIISLLADQPAKAASIVIVPRSLLHNWAAELDKFCPSLTYIIHHGPGRAKAMKEIQSLNIIITTYDTAVSDIELFKDFEFDYIILDESQAIKNPESKRYKAMRLLKSKNKLAMTGTPIENNTFDLYAQLSFTSPGLLGSKTSFKNNFAIPIDNNSDVEAATLLRKLIFPFVLRRTKDQVAKDLPEKTETIIYCEMGATQRKLYTNLKAKIKEDIESAVEEKGINKSKFQMLDGLLRLRQMCNSPLLVNSTFTGKNADAVKINVLLEHLIENTDQHNALVFSQFVSLLTIVRNELDKRGIPYAYLDGSTTKRQKEVDKFMNNDDIKIFLISIKAGNTGMNLTKADYVYILDPWWNPAVEAQAIDRTHRIGQDKQIFAYKLICKDSIEEKILKLQEKKKTLASDLIRTDENILKSLNKTELMSLFD